MAANLEDSKTALRVLEDVQDTLEHTRRLLKKRPTTLSLKRIAEKSENTHSWMNDLSSGRKQDPDMKCLLRARILLLEMKERDWED